MTFVVKRLRKPNDPPWRLPSLTLTFLSGWNFLIKKPPKTLAKSSDFCYLCMRNKNSMKHSFKTYCLLIVSILMLVASVFPHHHHEERFCLNADLETCCPSQAAGNEDHTTKGCENHACHADCITHFSFSSQHDRHIDVTPDYSFYSFIYPLLNVLERFTFHNNEAKEAYSIYIEKLHSRYCVTTGNLRAPPAFHS